MSSRKLLIHYSKVMCQSQWSNYKTLKYSFFLSIGIPHYKIWIDTQQILPQLKISNFSTIFFSIISANIICTSQCLSLISWKCSSQLLLFFPHKTKHPKVSTPCKLTQTNLSLFSTIVFYIDIHMSIESRWHFIHVCTSVGNFQ